MAFNARTKDLKSNIYSPTKPASEAAIRAQIDDSIQEVFDNVTTPLLSVTDGSSGADNVGATPLSGGSANTVQGVLEELKTTDSENVKLVGNQTIDGEKTFNSSPVIPNATSAMQPTTKGQVDTLDAQNVKITGNQTIAGEKTFSSSPIVPETPTASTQTASKGYVDASITGVAVGVLPEGSVTDNYLSDTAGQIKDRVDTNTIDIGTNTTNIAINADGVAQNSNYITPTSGTSTDIVMTVPDASLTRIFVEIPTVIEGADLTVNVNSAGALPLYKDYAMTEPVIKLKAGVYEFLYLTTGYYLIQRGGSVPELKATDETLTAGTLVGLRKDKIISVLNGEFIDDVTEFSQVSYVKLDDNRILYMYDDYYIYAQVLIFDDDGLFESITAPQQSSPSSLIAGLHTFKKSDGKIVAVTRSTSNSESYKGYGWIIDVDSNNVVTYSSASTLVPNGPIESVEMCELSFNKILMCYEGRSSNGYLLSGIVFTIDVNDNMTPTTETVLSGLGRGGAKALQAIDSQNALLIYYDDSTSSLSPKGKAQVLNIDLNDAITTNTPIVYDSSNTGDMSKSIQISNNKLIIVAESNTGVNMFTATGNVVSILTVAKPAPPEGSLERFDISKVDDDTIIYYQATSTDKLFSTLINYSLTGIGSFSDTFEIETSVSNTFLIAELMKNNKIAHIYRSSTTVVEKRITIVNYEKLSDKLIPNVFELTGYTVSDSKVDSLGENVVGYAEF